MSVEENKALVRRLYNDVVATGNVDLLSQLVGDEFVGHSPDVGAGIGGTSQGIAPLAGELTAIRTMLSDFNVTLEAVVGEGDRVAVRGVTRGRHTGEVPGIPPTGRDVTMTWAAIYRITGGKIVERWLNADDLSSFQQLGVIPPMPAPAA
jgi:predicted ester cyclase